MVLHLAGGEARADQAIDIARIHVEAIGGKSRIQALRALRMTGTVITGASRIGFTLVAARPNRVRLESHFAERTVVQGSDGVNPPWEWDSSKAPAAAVPMSPAAAEMFLIDADFDDPLIDWEEKGDTLQFAGEATLEGNKYIRLLVARSITRNIFLLVDPRTYLIAVRAQVLTPEGNRTEVATRYGQYRPVAGVLVAHEVSVSVNGRIVQRAQFDRVEANPALSDDAFTGPRPSTAKLQLDLLRGRE